MMRHIKRKFVIATKIREDVVKVLETAPVDMGKINELHRTNFANHLAIIETDGNQLIQAFKYAKPVPALFIPEANPIVIYFETARTHWKNIEEARSRVAKGDPNVYTSLNNFYQFFPNATICATFLFTSVEAFINSLIPPNYIYKRDNKQKTESFNRVQIQSYLPFEEKIKNVIPEIVKKSFHVEHSHKWESIVKLKDFRDAIMHTKSEERGIMSPNFYEELYNIALDFDYSITLIHVRDFLNYFEHNLIEECDCGKDY